jgi:hypothetical protein
VKVLAFPVVASQCVRRIKVLPHFYDEHDILLPYLYSL